MSETLSLQPALDALQDTDYIYIERSGVSTFKGTGAQLKQYLLDSGDFVASTQIGSNNGAASLNNVGVIPTSQLPFGTTDYLGVWNASTNSPSVSDGGGTGGQFYWVGTAGSQNLGSGSITFAVGNIVVHNGSIWQKVPISSAGVVTINGQTGVVVLTTADVADSTDARYVTDTILAALQSPTGPAPSGSNPFATENYVNSVLSGATIVVGRQFHTFQWAEDGTNSSGDGTVRTLYSLGYDSASAAAQWPLYYAEYGTINCNTTSYDDVVVGERILALATERYTKVESEANRSYQFLTQEKVLPNYKASTNNNKDSQRFIIDFGGCMYRDNSGGGLPLFIKDVSNQSDADVAVDWRWTLRNGTFKGDGVSGSCGFKFGATRSGIFEDLEFINFANGFWGAMLLNSRFSEVNSLFCTDYGVKINLGWWTGSGGSVSASQPRFYNCRTNTMSTTATGFYVYGSDTVLFEGCTAEGTDGAYGIFMDNANSGTAKNYCVRNLHAEIGGSSKFTNGVIGFDGRDAFTVELDTIFTQAGAINTVLLDAQNDTGTNRFILKNILGQNSPSTWKIRNRNINGGNGAYEFYNTMLQGNPQTAADVRNTSSFPNIWTGDSDIPTSNRVLFQPYLP